MRYYELNGFGIRPVEVDDLPKLAESRNHPTTWQNLGNPLPVWPHAQKAWLESLNDQNMFFIGYSLNDAKQKMMAFLRLTDIDWMNRNACVGIDVFPFYRGKGFGSEFFDLLVKYCFFELNLTRLWLLVMEGNVPAIRVYEKVGFQKEGVMRNHIFRKGAYKDYILMGLLREEYRANVVI